MSIPTRISGPLKSEIQHWTFLETWSGFLPWRTEFHHHFILRVDASARPLRGAVSSSQRHLDINAKEVLALSNVLLSFSESISNSLVDVFKTARSLLRPGKPSVGGLTHLFRLLSSFSALFRFRPLMYVHLPLHFTGSDANSAVVPSHYLSLQDSKLSQETWTLVQERFGGSSGHSVDLRALPSNVQSHPSGSPLLFFSPFPVPGSAGVNLFAQLPPVASLFSSPARMFFRQLFLSLRFCDLSLVSASPAPLLFRILGPESFGGPFLHPSRAIFWHLKLRC